MPRLTRIYTKTGDDGTTGLGGGQRVPKDAVRIEAYGTVDELNAAIGCALAARLEPTIASDLSRVQNELFHLGADLCVLEEDKPRIPGPRIEARHVEALEKCVDRLNEKLGALQNFILPAGSPGAAHLRLARTICRRAERRVVTLARDEGVDPEAVRYLNRLSDALFVMARWENHYRGIGDVLWESRT